MRLLLIMHEVVIRVTSAAISGSAGASPPEEIPGELRVGVLQQPGQQPPLGRRRPAGRAAAA